MKDNLSFFATISCMFAVVALVTAALIGEAFPGASILPKKAMLAKARQERLTSNIFPARPAALIAVKPSSPPIINVAAAESKSSRVTP